MRARLLLHRTKGGASCVVQKKKWLALFWLVSVVLPFELEGELLAATLDFMLDNKLGPLRDNKALVLYLNAKRLTSLERVRQTA